MSPVCPTAPHGSAGAGLGSLPAGQVGGGGCRAVAASSRPAGPWLDCAACQDTVTSADEDIFFAPDLDELGGQQGVATSMAATREQHALAVCDRCPVRVECLPYAAATRQQHGVWGGKTQQELGLGREHGSAEKRRPPVDVGVRHGPRPGITR